MKKIAGFIFALVSATLMLTYLVYAEVITTDEQGVECFAKAREIAGELGLQVDGNILIKVRPKDEIQVHYVSGGGRSINIGGYYRPFNPETIWVVMGQSRNITIAYLAHEFTHAWQSRNCPLQDRMLTEGLAMWVQYKTYLSLGENNEAYKLARWTDPDYGSGLRFFLELEKEKGIPGVLAFAKKETKPPKEWKDKFLEK